MATKRTIRRVRPRRAWVLVRFDDHEPVGRSVQRLKRAGVAAGWPGGASPMRVDRVKPVQRGKRRNLQTRRYHTFVEIHARNRAALDRAVDYIEQHFSHTDVYEF